MATTVFYVSPNDLHQHSKMKETKHRFSSLFCSVKDKLSRTPSMKSTESAESQMAPISPITSRGVSSNMSSNPFAGSTSSGRGRGGAQNFDAQIQALYSPKPAAAEACDSPPAYQDIVAPSITVQPPSGSANRGVSPTPSSASGITIESVTRADDQYAFLTQFDTIFLIDDSGSMSGSRWREVKEVLHHIAPICTSHDSDGIDVYFLNNKNNRDPEGGGYRNICTAGQVEALFNSVSPRGMTYTGRRLRQILKPYVEKYEQRVKVTKDPYETGIKPVNLIIITDGVPSDDPESEIVRYAKRLDSVDAPSYQVGLQFFQVGDDAGAKTALDDLDDNLGPQNGCRDMVDTVTWNGNRGHEHVLTAETILKTVLGAVVKRLDRKSVSVVDRRSLRP